MKHLKIILDLLLLPFLFLGLFLTPAYLLAEGGGGGGGGGTPPSSNNPTVRITPTSKTITEGDSGQKTVTVQIKIDKCPDTADIRIRVQTGNSSAKTNNGDYQYTRKYITFSKDSCTKTQSFSVKVYGDTNIEPNEKFYIRLYDRGTDNSQDFSWGDKRTTVNITNDDEGADLRMRKSANHDFYSQGDTVIYTLKARNLGPSPSKIHVLDSLPAGLSFISVSENKSDFSCSENGGTIECGGPRVFNKNQQVNIIIKAKVTADGYHAITNTATVDSSNNVTDPNTNNNTDSTDIDVNVPGGRDWATVVKTVDNPTPVVGQNVTFTVKITNEGLNKRIAIRDKFPLTDDDWGTSGGAFERVSYSKPADVTCKELISNGNPYLFCYSNGEYTHNQSFTVTIVAKVKKRGRICNKAWGYEYYWNNLGSDTVCMDATGVSAPVLAIPDFSRDLFTSVTIRLKNYTTDADGDTGFTYSNISGLPPGLTMNGAGVISGTLTEDVSATYPKDYTVNVTVTDSDGQTGPGSFTFTVTIPDLLATDNEYSGDAGEDITGNFITDDTGAGVDKGWRIAWDSCSNPTSGTVTCSADGSFTYTPSVDANITDYFTYIISDNSGDTAQATVILRLGDGGYTNQDVDFVRINPIDTWNILGDYLVIGNTVQCVTQKRGTNGESNSYGGTCQEGSTYFNNDYMTKYIDVDGDNSTWNSSSAKIIMPDTYDNNDSKGVLWAGLFWQGSANNRNSGFKQRRAKKNGAGFNYKNVTSNEAYSIASSPAKEILIKIDTDATYTPVIANRLNYDEEHGSFGGYYAAFADVTAFVQGKNLSKGEHTVTVANITSNEGREDNVGNYAGWSLVIIYKEDPSNDLSIPKNISIYQGFKVINGNGTIPTPERIQEIPITGFKLPSEGPVNAKLSVFAGEGEEIYGSTGTTFDKILLKRTASSPEEDIPNISDPSNIFDAHLAGVSRDVSNDNAIGNANGIDVDDYNVSGILEDFRDEDTNTNSLIIKMFSNDDYVIINMLAFSAELYVPKLCYDYTLDIAGDVLRSSDNQIKTPFGDQGDKLTTVIYLQSLDGDVPLDNIDIEYSIVDTAQVHYNSLLCSTEISETGKYDYSDACPYMHDASNAGFGMYIGTGKSGLGGGRINPNEDRYIKFDTEFSGSTIDTNFKFKVNYTVDFGSGEAVLGKEFYEKDRCEPASDGYTPILGFFNITDSSNQFPNNKWNLYTQTSRRAFDLNLLAYDASDPRYPIGSNLNLSVEVEMIRADNFARDANTACNDPHSKLDDVPVQFVHFDNSKDKIFGYTSSEVNLAYRNVAMRIWYLTDVNGTGSLTDDHNCTRSSQNACIDLYKRDYTTGGNCSSECADTSTVGCYDCLRTSYGHKVCSRDNFAIRPESFVLEVRDSNESEDTTKPNNTIANSTTSSAPFSLIAGYDYRFDINATNHVNNIATPRYKQHFSPNRATHYVHMEQNFKASATQCNDWEDQNISINVYNGNSVNTHTNIAYVSKVEQIGEYKLVAYDTNWTSADWDPDELIHHTALANPDYSSFFNSGSDCIAGSGVPSTGIAGNSTGCAISSVHTNSDTGISYDYLYAQYYPYTFKLDELTIGAGPDNVGDFVYINTLSNALYPNGQDENMSYNIQGIFTAVDRNGLPVSNFVNNCYAESVDMNLNSFYTHALPIDNANVRADIKDSSTVTLGTLTIGDTIRARTQIDLGTLTNLTSTANLSPLTVTQDPQHFAKEMNASISMDLGYNFTRTNNLPINPRKVTMKNFNVTYHIQPATVYVDMINDYKIVGERDIDQNVTFLYARAKPAKLVYDDVSDNDINTPVSVVLYCDLGFTVCQDRGILSLLAQTKDDKWWKSWNHDNSTLTGTGAGDGTIELVSTPVANALNNTTVDITSEGENNAVNVNNGGVAPRTVTVNLVTDPTLANYTDRWLIYNPNSATVIPTPFYRVRFIGPSGWTGTGQTGNVVGGNSNAKKNKRLEW
jgi:uncharacterized repeat protein (TIGR01451 family)